MFWHKAWLETRWRFLVGLALLTLSAAGTVFGYPELMKLVQGVPTLGGQLGRRVAEAVELTREYRGYVWSQWFNETLSRQWTLFAVLLGAGGLLPHAAGDGTLYTLSLPVSRRRLFAIRTVTPLAELLLLAFAPSFVLLALSPAIGQTYALGDALVHGACLFVAGSVFFSLTLLVSSTLAGLWRPLLVGLCAAFVLGLVDEPLRELSPFSLFRVMSAEAYFRGGGLPWIGLLFAAALSALMLYVAATNVARRDY